MILKSMIYLELENWISPLLDAVYIYNLLFKEDTREMRRQSRDCEILQIRDVIFASVDILMSAPVMQSSCHTPKTLESAQVIFSLQSNIYSAQNYSKYLPLLSRSKHMRGGKTVPATQ